MTTYVEFLGILTRSCERLRDAGLPDDKIEVFAKRWLERGPVAELEEMVNRLDTLGKVVGSGEEQATAFFADVMLTLDRIGNIASQPEALALSRSESPPPTLGPKYPRVRVDLAGLEDQLWPILRRVSYAMSDAGLDDAEIETYKNEMRNAHDPVGVSRRWVYVA